MSQLLGVVLSMKTQLLEAEVSVFVVQDRSDSLNYVELDIKLEQSIQQASMNQGGIVVQTQMYAVVVEFELISHDLLLIQNNCRKLRNERMMERHETNMYQELRSIRAGIFDANVSRLPILYEL